MLLGDLIKLAWHALAGRRLRSGLTVLGIAVGIAAVVLLTSLGEGLHQYVLAEFTQFGTNIIGINPGRTATAGMSGAIISNVRPLSLDDAQALKKLPQVLAAVPAVQGNAEVEYGRRGRRTNILGVNSSAPEVWRIFPVQGQFLPDDDPRTARAYVVLGSKVKTELFGASNPLNRRVRIGGERFRVIGVMESKGQLLGFDLDDAVYIPAGRAMAMFNQESLMEIDLLFEADADSDEVARRAKKLLIARHGSEDFNITTQDQMLEVLGSVLNILTVAVGALGGISLMVGGIGILTIMTIAVRERTMEIGLLRAIGAGRMQILVLFACEATMLGFTGGVVGLIMGSGGAWLLHAAIPALPTEISPYYLILSTILATTIGLLAGVLPARHASRLDPIEALHQE